VGDQIPETNTKINFNHHNEKQYCYMEYIEEDLFVSTFVFNACILQSTVHFMNFILHITIHLQLKLYNYDVSLSLINERSVRPHTHHHGSSIHNKDFVTIHNRVQPVSNCQNCAIGKLLSDSSLYQRIGPTRKQLIS
jgi:hypothetical protein